LDGKAFADDALFEVVGDFAVIDDAAHGAALEDDGRLRHGADGPDGSKQVLGAGGDADFLLSADDEIAIGQDGLVFGGDAVGFDVTLKARLMAGETPE